MIKGGIVACGRRGVVVNRFSISEKKLIKEAIMHFITHILQHYFVHRKYTLFTCNQIFFSKLVAKASMGHRMR